MFANKTTNNIFGNTGQGQTSLFGKTQATTGIFQGQQNQQNQQNQNQNNNNRGGTGLFSQGQGGQQSTLFGNTQQTGNTPFANTQGGSTLFGNTQTQGGNTMFGNPQTQGGNTQTQGGMGGLFQGATTAFGQNTQGGNNQMLSNFTQPNQTPGGFNQPGTLTGAGYGSGNVPTQFNQVNENQFYHLINAPIDQQKRLFEAFSADYIKQLIVLYRKALDLSKVDRLQLGADNPLRGQKVTKVATALNIKPHLMQIKKLIKNNVTNRAKELKDNREKLHILSLDFSAKVFEKLQRYKEKLVLSVTQNKMIDEIKKEVEELDQQIKQFFKPLFNAHQNRTNYSFIDPDPFCLKVSQRLLKNMTVLDNKMDQFLACQTEPTQETIDTGDVIVQLVEYYQNVAVTLREFSEKYNKLKRALVHKNRQTNPEDVLRKLSEKASSIVSKEMETYELVKEIELLLKKRDGKMNQNKIL